MRFSRTTQNFYPENIDYTSLPDDIVTVPDDDFNLAMARADGATMDVQAGRIVIIAPPEPALASLIAEKQIAVDKYRDSLFEAGMPYQGKVLQLDDSSRANIASQSLAALGSKVDPVNIPWDSNSYWIMADNSHLALPTADDMYALGNTARLYVAGCIFYGNALKTQIGSVTDKASLEAIDITQGWPA